MSIIGKEGEARIVINGVAVHLPASLEQFFELDGNIVVLVDPEWSHENVFAYDRTGRLLWTIEKYPYAEWDESGYRMLISRSGSIWAYALSTHFELDIKTGRILSSFSEK